MKRIENLELELKEAFKEKNFIKEGKRIDLLYKRMNAFSSAAQSYCNYLISIGKLRKEKHNPALFYDFIPNESYSLIPIIQYFKLQNIVDLGCGPGNIVMVANEICPVKSFGFDFDKNIIYAGKQLRPELNLKRKDIFELKTKDISLADAVYMYQPARDAKTMLKMLKKVLDCMRTEQMLLYKMAMYGNYVNLAEKILENETKCFSRMQGWCIAIK